jgi:hypothetical protein
VLALRPQNNGDDSSGWHVNSVRMQPYVAHPSTLVRVWMPVLAAFNVLITSSAEPLYDPLCQCAAMLATPSKLTADNTRACAAQQGHVVPPAEGDPVGPLLKGSVTKARGKLLWDAGLSGGFWCHS